MRLLAPGFLSCAGLLPWIMLAYLWGLNRRQRYVVRMSSLSLVRKAAGNPSRWRRHLPFGSFLFALSSLIVAMSRPAIKLDVPAKQGIMILALDVSRSMCSPDIQPTRIEALEVTLVQFIAAQSAATKIGVIAFSDFADPVLPPTGDKAAVDRAIKSLMTGWKRAVGEGIFEALEVIAREQGANASRSPGAAPTHTSPSSGGYAPAIIILVTNGVNDTGRSPLEAAWLAAERGVRIYTVGLSSPSGPLDASCQSSDPSGFVGEIQHHTAGVGGLDAETLKQIAALTGAKYFPAPGLSGLKNVFQDAQLQSILIRENIEISFAFVILGGLFTLVAFYLALFRRPLL